MATQPTPNGIHAAAAAPLVWWSGRTNGTLQPKTRLKINEVIYTADEVAFVKEAFPMGYGLGFYGGGQLRDNREPDAMDGDFPNMKSQLAEFGAKLRQHHPVVVFI